MQRLFLILLALVASVTAFEVLHAEGDHYSVGHQIGSRFKTEISSHIRSDPSIQRMVSYVHSKSGSSVYNSFVDSVSAAFPHFIEEVRGIADGAGLPFATVMTSNMMAELSILAGGERVTDCSDILLKDENNAIIAHNEDGASNTLKSSYIVRARFTDNSSDTGYTSFHYPGQLAGDSFGFNEHGIIFSTNALFPKDIRAGGIPRVFLGRDLLSATSISDFISKINAPHYRASGFSINVGDLHSGRIFNIELSPFTFAVREISGLYGHFNQYLNLNTSHFVEPSSDHRLTSFDKMKDSLPRNLNGLLQVLGDTSDKEYPIYRDGSPPDNSIVTLCTAVFDMRQKTLSVYSSNPKEGNPTLLFDLRD